MVSAIQLSRAGLEVTLIERKAYPLHRVCGEYVSNEVKPFLESLGLFPNHLQLPQISEFLLSDLRGRSVSLDLPLGGFGISRHAFDHFLYQKAIESGVSFRLNTQVSQIDFANDQFEVFLDNNEALHARFVIGAFGKRSLLDKQLNRSFIKKRSPYIGVKYHVEFDVPENLISLHNFRGGYCGVSKVENGITNVCYLGHRDLLREHKDIKAMEKAILYENPHLRRIFTESKPLFEQPLVINEISFEAKQAVENHVLMIGDSAGLITPLCGNGMALAIHSAKILSEHIIDFFKEGKVSRKQLELNYSLAWKEHFKTRLSIGRSIQHLFGSGWASGLTVASAKFIPSVARQLIKQTHGNPF